MSKQRSASVASTAGARWSSDASTGALIASIDGAHQVSRQPIVRYVGFRSTARGREYTMRVGDGVSTREFVLVISHQAFAAREARFQDAPDVCSGKLRRELAVDPGLVPGDSMAVTTQDLQEYRGDHLTPIEKRARVKP
jgi:hypothetical protein